MPAIFVPLSVTGGMLGATAAAIAGLSIVMILTSYFFGGLMFAGSGCVLAARRS